MRTTRQTAAQRVSAQATELTGTQQKKANGDAVAMGVGLVVFWPALFFIKGDRETSGQLASLTDQMDAIQQASIAKNCGITVQTYGDPTATTPIRVTAPPNRRRKPMVGVLVVAGVPGQQLVASSPVKLFGAHPWQCHQRL